MISLVLSIILSAPLQGASVSRFPVGYLDFHGFVPVEKKALSVPTRKGMTLLERGESKLALPLFFRAWEEHPRDLVALHGMVLAAKGQGDVGSLIAGLNRSAGSASSGIDPQSAFALFYATSLAREFQREGDKKVQIPGYQGVPTRYSVALGALPPTARNDDRKYVVMLSSAHFANGDYALARRPLIDWLARHPKDALIHVMLGRMYQSGILSHQSGSGPRRPASQDERMDMDKANLHYRKALTADPQCAEAYYEMGLIAFDKDPKRLYYLKQAIKLGLRYPLRKASAQEKIRELGG